MSTEENSSNPDIQIRNFKAVPKLPKRRTYRCMYPFNELKAGQSIEISIKSPGAEKRAKKAKQSLYSGFYRYAKKNPEAKSWKRAIRATFDHSGKPILVGFYRIS